MTSGTTPVPPFYPELRLVSGNPVTPSRRVRRTRLRGPEAVVPRTSARRRADRAGRLRAQAASGRAELLTTVSHELRTPLTSVLGYAEVLLCLDAGDLNPEQVIMLERIATNGQRLLELIEGLLRSASERGLGGSSVDISDVFVHVLQHCRGADADEPVPPTELEPADLG